jgi:hypothetical protein
MGCQKVHTFELVTGSRQRDSIIWKFAGNCKKHLKLAESQLILPGLVPTPGSGIRGGGAGWGRAMNLEGIELALIDIRADHDPETQPMPLRLIGVLDDLVCVVEDFGRRIHDCLSSDEEGRTDVLI